MPMMTKEQMELLKELNGLPEFMHNGRLCVEVNGNIIAKEAIVKTILVLG